MLSASEYPTASPGGEGRNRGMPLEAAARACMAQALGDAPRDLLGERVVIMSVRACADLRACVDRYAGQMHAAGESAASARDSVSRLLNECLEGAHIPTSLHHALWHWVEQAWADVPQAAAPRAYRTIHAEGATWLVHELDENEWRPRPVLVFESELVMRAVNHYPAAWHELGDDELYAVSWVS
jgi:hypothetical protein